MKSNALILTTAVAFLSLVAAAGAVEVNKANTTTTLNLAGSWVSGGPPGLADVAVWNTEVTTTTTYTLGASVSWAGLKVLSPAADQRIRSTTGLSLTLGAAGVDLSLATRNFAADATVLLGASQSWNVAAGRTLSTAGLASSGGYTLTKNGEGILSLTGVTVFAGGLSIQAGSVQSANTGGIQELSGALSGTGPFNKSGAGALSLSGDNTNYSGALALTSGSLNLNRGSALGGATLTLTGGGLGNTSGAAVTLTAGSTQNWNGDFSYMGTSDLDLGGSVVTLSGTRAVTVGANTLTVSGTLGGTGSLTKLGAGTLRVVAGAAVDLTGKLATTAGVLRIDGGTVACGTAGGNFEVGGTGAVELNGGTLVVPAVAGLGGTSSLAFNGGALRASAGSTVFMSGLAAAKIGAAGAVIEPNGNAVTLSQVLSHDAALGAVADGGLLVRDVLGGTVTLTGASTYTGPTVIESGTLALRTGGSLAGSKVIQVAGGAGLDGTTGVTLSADQTLTGTGSLSGKLTIGAGATLAPGGSTTLGSLGGSADLILLGTASFRVEKLGAFLTTDAVTSGSVTYGGTLTVSASGTSFAAGDRFKLFEAGTYSGSFSTLNLPEIGGSGLFWDASRLTVDGTLVVTNVVPVPVFSPVAGSYFGAQSVTITGIAGSTIRYTTDGSDPATSSTTQSGPTPQTGIMIPVNSTGFTLKAYASVAGFPASGIVSAVYNTLSAAVWTLDGSGNWSEAVNWLLELVPDGGEIAADFSTRTLSADATVTLDSPRTLGNLQFGDVGNAFKWVLAGSTLTLAGAGGPVITVNNQATTFGVSVAGSNGFIKNGAGDLTLGAANTYTGTTTVNSGTLVLQNTSASTGYAMSTGAVLELNVATGTRDHPATSFSGTGGLRKTGAGSFMVGSSAGTFALGAGALIDVQAGTLTAGSYANEIWTANLADLNVAAGAVFDAVEATSVANGGVFVDALSGSGTIKVGYAGSYANKITFGVDNGSGSFSGVLADASAAGNFVKAGSGTQTLGGACTYTGSTTVNGGALVVNGSLAAASAVTIAAGTLGGSGTVAGTVVAAGVLAPGATSNTTGTLALGATTLAGTYQSQLDGTSCDVIAVTGNLNLTGATLAVAVLAGGSAGGPYLIATYTGTRTGTFATVPAGYTVDYSTPNQVKLAVGGGGYASWIDGFGLTGDAALAGADPDRDGIANSLEFVLGGNPAAVMDAALLPTIAVVTNPGGTVPAGTYLKFSYRRTPASAYLNPGMEFDADLTGAWTAAVAGQGGVVEEVTAGFYTTPTPADRVEVFVPRAGNEAAGKLFGHLRVIVP